MVKLSVPITFCTICKMTLSIKCSCGTLRALAPHSLSVNVRFSEVLSITLISASVAKVTVP
jgi:hypothetical protein